MLLLYNLFRVTCVIDVFVIPHCIDSIGLALKKAFNLQNNLLQGHLTVPGYPENYCKMMVSLSRNVCIAGMYIL